MGFASFNKKKGDTNFRLVSDYHWLNAVTSPNCYPIPNLNDFSANLHYCHVFFKVDLFWAYQQIQMNPVRTLFSSFKFLSIPFGLQNTMRTFQRFINEVVRRLDFVFAYVVDFLKARHKRESSPAPICYFNGCVLTVFTSTQTNVYLVNHLLNFFDISLTLMTFNCYLLR